MLKQEEAVACDPVAKSLLVNMFSETGASNSHSCQKANGEPPAFEGDSLRRESQTFQHSIESQLKSLLFIQAHSDV